MADKQEFRYSEVAMADVIKYFVTGYQCFRDGSGTKMLGHEHWVDGSGRVMIKLHVEVPEAPDEQPKGT